MIRESEEAVWPWEPLAIPKKIGRFEVLEEIGHGPMSVDYRANDPATGRAVVLTVPSAEAEDSPDLLRRFYREARATGSLQHPNVIAIYDLGVYLGSPYIARELLEGSTLEEIVAREKAEGTRSAQSGAAMLNYVMQACKGLGYAHQHGVIHRDVRPRSVFVTTNGTVKMTHFVNARLPEGLSPVSDGSKTGQMDYTYMSPEQVRGGRLDGGADIWALACTLYEALTYSPPFVGENTSALMFAIMSEEPDPISELRRDLPPELEDVLKRALKKDRKERYKNMEEMMEALEKVAWKIESGV